MESFGNLFKNVGFVNSPRTSTPAEAEFQPRAMTGSVPNRRVDAPTQVDQSITPPPHVPYRAYRTLHPLCRANSPRTFRSYCSVRSVWQARDLYDRLEIFCLVSWTCALSTHCPTRRAPHHAFPRHAPRATRTAVSAGSALTEPLRYGVQATRSCCSLGQKSRPTWSPARSRML